MSDRSDVSCGQLAAQLMGLLGTALLALPEQEVPAVWAELRAEHLCVLANHDEPEVRAAVLKVSGRTPHSRYQWTYGSDAAVPVPVDLR